MKLQAFNCPNCKAPLSLPSGSQDRRFIFCKYCGTKIMIDDIEYYREDSKTERERIRADRDVLKVSVDRNADVEKERLKRDADSRDMKTAAIVIGMLLLSMAFLLIFGAVMSRL